MLLWRQRSRWTVLIASCWVEATAGASYVFGTYSGVLKSELGYDQRHVDRLSVAKDLGDAVGLAAGFLCKVLPNWAVLSLGALLIFAGYGFLWLLVDHRIPALPFWIVCVLIFVGTNGCTYLDTAALVACIQNFPTNRGTVVGLLKGFKGLCGAIFNQIYASFLAPDETSFILLLALGPAVIMMPLILLMGPVSPMKLTGNHAEDITFKLLYGASVLLASYMFSVTLVQDLATVSSTINIVLTVFLFLILLLLLPAPKITKYFTSILEKSGHDTRAPLLEERSSAAADCEPLEDGFSRVTTSPNSSSMPQTEASPAQGSAVEGISKLKLGADFTLLKAFGNLDFWVLFFSVFFSLGSGTTAFNNLGQMGQAQGYQNTQVFVSMTNIWNFIGRLAGGYVSERSTRSYGHPRSVVLAMAQLIMAMGHVMFATAWPGTIYLAIFLVGTGYGAHWAIFPTALSELFGLQNFSVLYNFLSMASPAGSLIYSGYIAGTVYDWQARKQSDTTSNYASLECKGTVCFELTFFIMAAVCVMGAALSILLAMRTRMLYSKRGPGDNRDQIFLS